MLSLLLTLVSLMTPNLLLLLNLHVQILLHLCDSLPGHFRKTGDGRLFHRAPMVLRIAGSGGCRTPRPVEAHHLLLLGCARAIHLEVWTRGQMSDRRLLLPELTPLLVEARPGRGARWTVLTPGLALGRGWGLLALPRRGVVAAEIDNVSELNYRVINKPWTKILKVYTMF